MKDIEKIEDLVQDSENCNEGAARGQGVIEESLQRLGAGRSIVVDKNGKTIAGNNVLQKAQELGFDVEVVHTNGTKLVVVVRDDLDLDKDARARELSIADNRASELGLKWRMDRIENARLKNSQLKLDYMFTADEMRSRLAEAAERQFGGGGQGKEITCPSCGEKIKP
jgi:hypothetical protein